MTLEDTHIMHTCTSTFRFAAKGVRTEKKTAADQPSDTGRRERHVTKQKDGGQAADDGIHVSYH